MARSGTKVNNNSLTAKQRKMAEALTNPDFDGTVTELCESLNVPRRTYYHWLEKPEFREYMTSLVGKYADSGLRVADWESGYSQRLDSAVRRNIMDGLRQLSNEEQKLLGDEFGADGYEISAHVNPAPDHAAIQGRQYSKADYEALNESLDRKIGTLNCYHTITAIVLGVSTPVYSAAQLDEMKRKSEELIDIGGRKYTRYECTQLQRQLETAVRKAKDRKKLFEAAGDKEAVEKEKRRIRAYKEKYDAVTKAAGLDKHTDRMSVPRPAKSVDFSAKSDIIKAESELMYRKTTKDKIEPMPAKQFRRIEKAFKKQGGIFQYDRDTEKYLESQNAEAITYNATTVLFKSRPGRASVFEELIHTHQYKVGKNDGSYLARLECEIEAQKKLLSHQKAYRLTEVEIEQTKKALEAYEAEYIAYIQKGGN